MHSETDRVETQEPLSEQNSLRFAESQRESDLVESSDSRTESFVVGEPDRLAEYWEQQAGDMDCAIYAEGSALKALDRPFDADQSRADGIREGTYSPEGGTDLEAVGRVWEREGLQVERFGSGEGDVTLNSPEEAFGTLEDRLAEGKAVVAVVDNGPLGGEGGGHAVWVTGMEASPEGEVQVITNDPGRPDGAGKQYSVEDFERAWRSYEYQMVVTRDSFPDPEDR